MLGVIKCQNKLHVSLITIKTKPLQETPQGRTTRRFTSRRAQNPFTGTVTRASLVRSSASQTDHKSLSLDLLITRTCEASGALERTGLGGRRSRLHHWRGTGRDRGRAATPPLCSRRPEGADYHCPSLMEGMEDIRIFTVGEGGINVQ
ncbi:hypothetical protein J6590_091591 [Homalodisca vitripennis]|nr:hypothetical protein J6590_044699 [Homalodisca vitripennis]KAG8294943.1 hypothetical protein J6590_091591 [Homalodisca vitripennis]